ncbi:MAG: hypothetical protein KGL10_05885 [Alphaproteobacteria bacterium]|nr:hypothetical protein [Alphaproteobacteria bacterium]MDE2336824.1 hypothetical protein [Alphaproteobacteria bacterium]
MRQRHFALLAALLLAGCAHKPPPTGICPTTGFIDNTDTITYLAPDAVKGAGEKNVAVRGSINGYSGSCAFADKKKDAVLVDLKVPFVAQKGPAGAGLKQQEFPYFIAVLSPQDEILQRTAFTVTVDFDKGDSGENTEDHSIRIPLPHGTDGASRYKVIIGFALTHAQYDYNKERKK